MDDKRKGKPAKPRNESAGNRTAAEEYNRAQRRFVTRGKVEDQAREALEALEAERDEIERAEDVGERQVAEEVPQDKRRYALLCRMPRDPARDLDVRGDPC